MNIKQVCLTLLLCAKWYFKYICYGTSSVVDLLEILL